MLDYVEARQLAQEGKTKESLLLLLERAYNLTEDEIYKLPKKKVNNLLTGIKGMSDGLKCQNCGGPVDKLLCSKCVQGFKTIDEFGKMLIDSVKPEVIAPG